jgi:uncharacterized protein
MKKIALISDSHGHLDSGILDHLKEADEIWHAGDIGDIEVLNILPSGKQIRVITGNIDDQQARLVFPEELVFVSEGVKVLMLHIGGKPPGYSKGVKERIRAVSPHLFVCGHSHICKVEFDKNHNCLYMNPGAVGHQGFHVMRTMLLFELENGKIKNLRVVELGRRGK